MGKKTSIIFGIIFIFLGLFFVFREIKIFDKISSLGVVNYSPAQVGNLLEKTEPAKIPGVTLTFAGDMMLDRGVESSVKKNFAGDFSMLFVNASELFLNDDITFLNLEGPVSDKGHNVGSKYSFEMNPLVLPVIKNSGIDVVSFANNHVGDYTIIAFKDTLVRLSENNILFAGAGNNYTEAKTPTIITKNGMTVGYLAFSDVGPNWLPAKDGNPGKNTSDNAGILLASDPNFSQIISEAKTKVDVLVVSFHWGDEYKAHNIRQEKLAHLAIDSGADIIAGGHPHVAQDLETYNDKLIIYSLGNFIFDQYFSKETMQGLVVQTTISKDGVITDTKKYTNQLNKFYAIESIVR